MIIVFLIIVLVFILPSIHKKQQQNKNNMTVDEQITDEDCEELHVVDVVDDDINFLG